MKLFMLVFGSSMLNPENSENIKLSDTDIPHLVESHVESAGTICKSIRNFNRRSKDGVL